ncbi:extracellular solute-binding protein [Treponema socranskii]|uniref:extracellular solute-binding protein n=1 Tax=Treponema socranskii TaxID=53419 RepID=UPI0023F3FA11|nr:extracellular solute-binding protein [Treponema socranskii]
MKKMMMLCALAAAAIMATSCTKKPEAVTIEFWTHEDANRQKLEDRYIQEFTAAHPNVTVNVTRQGAAKLIELVQTAFAAGSGPTMFNLSINDEYPYITAGRVAAMNYKAAGYKDASDVINAYAPKMLDPVTVDGKVYGLPLELTNWCIFINKKVFRSAGLDPETDYPKTWEDMVKISKKIVTRNGDIITRRGYDFRYKYYLENNVPMVEQLGGQLISDDGKEAIVGKDAWIAVLSYLKQWGPKGLNLGSPTYKNAHSLFNADNNDVTMCLSGLYQEARIRNQNPNFYDSGDWMIIPYPKFQNAVKDVAACYYGHYYMVNADATKAEQEASWQLISYMLSHGEEYLSEVNIVQPTLALLNSKTFKDMPYSEVFANDLNRAHIVYYGAASASIQSALKTALQNVMLGDASPETVYEQLKKTVQDLIDEQK